MQGSIPISAMVVAPSGAGKSRTLIRFDCPYVFRADDLTSSGLVDVLANDKENKIKYLLIPDFNPILSHKASVSNLLMANLLSVTQDGTARIVDGRQNKEVRHNPVGILTAVTFEMFARSSRKWHELGIVRRIIPLHYTYSLQTIHEAQTLIRKGKITSNIEPLSLSNYKQTNVSIPTEHASQLETFSMQLASNLGQRIRLQHGEREPQLGTAILPMAPHIVLSSVARGNAVRYGRKEVNSTDVRLALDFVSFTDMINRRQL